MALIYDVGMYDGADTAFYLSRGHRVVAIDASEEIVGRVRQRFAREIKSGDLTILQVAVSESSGPITFWVSEDRGEWSSLNREIASRSQGRHRSTTVLGREFGSILEEHGCPSYLKIDIEGADHLCFPALIPQVRPQYISVEAECGGDKQPLNEEQYLFNIKQLKKLGYTKFKLVHQGSFVPIYRGNYELIHSISYRKAIRASIEQRLNWHFPDGSSGPWGEDILGPWMTYDDAILIYRLCRSDFFRLYDAEIFAFWFDWHATY